MTPLKKPHLFCEHTCNVTDQLAKGSKVRLTVIDFESNDHEPTLKMTIKKSENTDFVDLAEPFSNQSPLSA